MPDHDPQTGIPQVRDQRPKIAGLLPKNTQNRLLAGIALAMVVVIMFSGRKSAPPKAAGLLTAATAVDPSQTRIQEYRSHLDEQTQKLAAEEARLTQTEQALGSAPHPSSTGIPGGRGTATSWGSPPATYRSEPERNWMDIDREKRAYQSLYASNIALTYRRPPADPTIAGSITLPSEMPRGDASPNGSKRSATPSDVSSNAAGYRLLEGTIIETVLTNRLDSSLSGPVNCMVTTNVYSHDHQVLLIPQGTRVLGEARKLESLGDQRLAVVFHRLIMPDGSSATLDKFQGLDQVGETGLRDQVNHHYVQVFGVSIALGAIAGLAQAGSRYSAVETPAQAYEQGVTDSLSQSAMHILDRYLNVLPTFTIREGYRIKIYLSQDLSLPAYGQGTSLVQE